MSKHSDDRRSFLSGRMVRSQLEHVGNEIADELAKNRVAPSGGDTLRLSTRAMACEFSIIMNPGLHDLVMEASRALDRVHELESQLSVYRDDSEVSALNQHAASEAFLVQANMFELVRLAISISEQTDGFFDLTSGKLIELWRMCRAEERIPFPQEMEETLQCVGMDKISIDQNSSSIHFTHPGTKIDFGAIGKGYALDRSRLVLQDAGVEDFLLHGGHSSLLAQGDHNQTGGWPVGIGNPLFREQRLGTILLRDQAMSTSGSNIQFFRHAGKRYGHILNPKTGWPVEGALSVTVFAADAARADALSTAFYAMGEEKIEKFCDAHPEIGAIVIPFPRGGRKVTPKVIGISDEIIYWDDEQVQSI